MAVTVLLKKFQFNDHAYRNLWAYRELEMQKLTTQNGGEGQKMKIQFAIGIKTVGGIFMKFRIWFRCQK